MSPPSPASTASALGRASLRWLACALLLAGCETRSDLKTANTAFLARLEELQPLLTTDSAAQARLLADRRRAYETAPSPATSLHYGLLLALPGHPGHDAPAARPLLALAVESSTGLIPSERALARAALAELDARLSLAEDNRRLADEIITLRDGASVARSGAARRLQAELDENARLRRALDEARSKLQRVADLERAAAIGKPAPKERKP